MLATAHLQPEEAIAQLHALVARERRTCLSVEVAEAAGTGEGVEASEAVIGAVGAVEEVASKAIMALRRRSSVRHANFQPSSSRAVR